MDCHPSGELRALFRTVCCELFKKLRPRERHHLLMYVMKTDTVERIVTSSLFANPLCPDDMSNEELVVYLTDLLKR